MLGYLCKIHKNIRKITGHKYKVKYIPACQLAFIVFQSLQSYAGEHCNFLQILASFHWNHLITFKST
jgi:hypothetical protein